MAHIRLACLVVAIALLHPAAVRAQQAAEEPDSKARVRFGPLAMTPTLSLANLGQDDNVYNEPDQLSPKSDLTMTVTPATDLWLHMGRAWVTGRIQEDLVYYRRYVDQRSANQLYRVGLLAPLNRLRVTANGTHINSHERPGYEIDARPQHYDNGVDATIEIRALSKTFFGVRGERRTVTFADGQTFRGADLRSELTRVVTTGAVTIRHNLTPLTSITADVSRDQDRFRYDPLRDSNSTRVNLGVQFDPFALIKGSAAVGYRDLKPLSPGMPAFTGVTAQADLTYVALGATKLGIQVMRDVQYSYDATQPYYLQSGGTASIQQQIYGPFDVSGRIGAQTLDYRDQTGVAVAAPHRSDTVRLYGGGAGYRLGRDLRIGVSVDKQRRTSVLAERTYSGLRFGISVTYGS